MIIGIEAHRRSGVSRVSLRVLFDIISPLEVVIQCIGPGETSIGTGIVWVDFPRLLEKIPCGCIVFTGEFKVLVPASHKVIVGGEAIRVYRGQTCEFSLSQFALPPRARRRWTA